MVFFTDVRPLRLSTSALGGADLEGKVLAVAMENSRFARAEIKRKTLLFEVHENAAIIGIRTGNETGDTKSRRRCRQNNVRGSIILSCLVFGATHSCDSDIPNLIGSAHTVDLSIVLLTVVKRTRNATKIVVAATKGQEGLRR